MIYKIPSASSWDSKLWIDGCCVPVINNKKIKIKKNKYSALLVGKQGKRRSTEITLHIITNFLL